MNPVEVRSASPVPHDVHVIGPEGVARKIGNLVERFTDGHARAGSLPLVGRGDFGGLPTRPVVRDVSPRRRGAGGAPATTRYPPLKASIPGDYLDISVVIDGCRVREGSANVALRMHRYAVRSDRVTHQNIDGEVIAIHFDTGVYYSMTGSAVVVWERLVDGASVSDIVESFSDPPGDAGTTITTFLDTLVLEGLVEPRDEVAPREDRSTRGPWAPPRLDKFTDMSDLIMADPIHGVDETGWPNPVQPRGDPEA